MRDSLCTTTDVRKRLLYKLRPPALPTNELTSDNAKIERFSETTKKMERKKAKLVVSH